MTKTIKLKHPQEEQLRKRVFAFGNNLSLRVSEMGILLRRKCKKNADWADAHFNVINLSLRSAQSQKRWFRHAMAYILLPYELHVLTT